MRDAQLKTAQLRAVVSLYLVNGMQTVDACNDTRYWGVAATYEEAYALTRALVKDGLLEPQWGDYSKVTPTAKGIFVALGGLLHEED